MFKRTILGVSVFGMVALAPPVFAQTVPCGPRADVIERLNQQYGEIPAAGGLRSTEQLMEIWAAPDTGSWTALVTSAQGISCIVATGTDWHQEKRLVASNDLPS